MQQRFGIGSWVRRHPAAVDSIVVAIILVINLVGLSSTSYAGLTFRPADGWAVALNLACTLPLLARRRYPVTVALTVLSAYLALGFLDYASFAGSVAVLIAIYTLGVYAAVVPGLTITLVASVASILYLFDKRDEFAAGGTPVDAWMVAAQLLVYLGLWIVARTVRTRRLYLAELEDRADRLERTASAELRAALAEERARMARELHDVVAHHVSVMTVQAAAARRMLERAPDASLEAMQAVEETGRAALVEMRRMVGALRGADPSTSDVSTQPAPDDLSPQPGIAELAPLLSRAREAGLDVDLTVVGEPRQLPSGVDLAIFRVVQESLTNTLRHAGPTRAAVLLRYEPAAVVVGITDDGARKRTPAARTIGSERPGHGLMGMRERITLNGGTLRTGPRSVGGYEVHARLPVEEAAT